MADFLLELRCEEIPARMQAGARAELEKLFRRELEAAGVKHDNLRIWSTPRRLALIAYDLPDATEAVSEEAKGPPEGAPDAAIDGFCKKAGVTRDQLELRDVKGRMTYFAVVNIPGRPMAEVLKEVIFAIVLNFSWPKSMRWGEASRQTTSLRWVRPLSGIVALFDGEIVGQGLSANLDGIEPGRTTYGHRFHASGPIIIDSADDYAAKLRAAHVIVDHEERQNIIRECAAKVAAEAGLTLVEDEGLVIENAGLTEWPVPLLGRFDETFLDVPPEVIQLTARVNQKYFVCEGEGGKLANAFVCTANIAPLDPAVVVDGNRKVLAARLSDARFFWEQDQKTPLAVHAEKLARITFHEKLGTVADKVERVAKLARWLCEEGIILPGTGRGTSEAGGGASGAAPTDKLSDRGGSPLHHPADGPPPLAGEDRARLADLAEAAARLCKADLVTEMVGEFPELQGLMGGYYAAKEGLPQEVAEAIRDHYKPVGQGDDVPTAPVTVAVSLADKLETIVAFFAIDEKPTGSKDPFALRRAAIGVLSILGSSGIRIKLQKFIERVATFAAEQVREKFDAALERADVFVDLEECCPDPFTYRLNLIDGEWDTRPRDYAQGALDAVKASNLNFDNLAHASHVGRAVADFFADRLKVQQREAGVRHDLIDAVFALGGEDDLVRLLARVHALQAFVTTEDGTNLLAGYKRAANILKKEGYAESSDRLERSRETLDGGLSTSLDANGNQGIPETGEEDPLALIDDPDVGDIVAEGAVTGSALSYNPEPAEQALIDALDAAAPRAAAAVAGEKFADAMAALATLRAPIDRFFDEVTVNDPQADKRAARLALLARFRDAVHRVADFSRIEG
ncbi:glycine--tRNA ligase subunit beta [Erythrobacter sp. WG]|uniref:glycine--tRNA ligase subunit beta n=1 Tax=Erythrobacter sp. WG TaxID=2985510 RepID=UPI00226F7FE4|nr:glycine--tRNA ligase subunit beta [Erythrobacter sp. WG]MCX9146189.1 glycine--tRNA ligase subunit beta [Erythrobacter sp. WG]